MEQGFPVYRSRWCQGYAQSFRPSSWWMGQVAQTKQVGGLLEKPKRYVPKLELSYWIPKKSVESYEQSSRQEQKNAHQWVEKTGGQCMRDPNENPFVEKISCNIDSDFDHFDTDDLQDITNTDNSHYTTEADYFE